MPLYNAAILRLASEIPHARRLDSPQGAAERRSPICGSHMVVEVVLDSEGRVAEIGQRVSACALGQASASLMGVHAIGRTAAELGSARAALADYLAGARDDPGDWPGLDVFAAARRHVSRHAAILLPFEAAAEAAAEAAGRAAERAAS